MDAMDFVMHGSPDPSHNSQASSAAQARPTVSSCPAFQPLWRSDQSNLVLPHPQPTNPNFNAGMLSNRSAVNPSHLTPQAQHAFRRQAPGDWPFDPVHPDSWYPSGGFAPSPNGIQQQQPSSSFPWPSTSGLTSQPSAAVPGLLSARGPVHDNTPFTSSGVNSVSIGGANLANIGHVEPLAGISLPSHSTLPVDSFQAPAFGVGARFPPFSHRLPPLAQHHPWLHQSPSQAGRFSFQPPQLSGQRASQPYQTPAYFDGYRPPAMASQQTRSPALGNDTRAADEIDEQIEAAMADYERQHPNAARSGDSSPSDSFAGDTPLRRAPARPEGHPSSSTLTVQRPNPNSTSQLRNITFGSANEPLQPSSIPQRDSDVDTPSSTPPIAESPSNPPNPDRRRQTTDRTQAIDRAPRRHSNNSDYDSDEEMDAFTVGGEDHRATHRLFESLGVIRGFTGGVRAHQLMRGQMSNKRVASKTAISSLQSVDIDSLPESERMCVICYNDFGVANPEGINEAPLRIPGCKHIFGDHCIKKWFEESDSCPYCRTKVHSEPLGLAGLGRNGDLAAIHQILREGGMRYPAEVVGRLQRMRDSIDRDRYDATPSRTSQTGERRSSPADAAESSRRTRARHNGLRTSAVPSNRYAPNYQAVPPVSASSNQSQLHWASSRERADHSYSHTSTRHGDLPAVNLGNRPQGMPSVSMPNSAEAGFGTSNNYNSEMMHQEFSAPPVLPNLYPGGHMPASTGFPPNPHPPVAHGVFGAAETLSRGFVPHSRPPNMPQTVSSPPASAGNNGSMSSGW